MIAQFTSLFLAGLMLFQSFNIHIMDLMKLDNLIEHVQFHRSNYNDDLFTFLNKHYGQTEAEEHHSHESNDNKADDHEELPFDHSICDDAVPIIVFNLNIYQYTKLIEHKHITPHYYYENSYSYLENVDIFQPPQTT